MLPFPMAAHRRIVVDTNVVVAALLHPDRNPARALQELVSRGWRLLYDARIEDEYREVLGRAKLRMITAIARERLLGSLLLGAERIVPDVYVGALPDDDDRAFVEVCISGHADILLTGNGRDFPRGLGFEIAAPAELLGSLGVALTGP